jgi:hypothetical protein
MKCLFLLILLSYVMSAFADSADMVHLYGPLPQDEIFLSVDDIYKNKDESATRLHNLINSFAEKKLGQSIDHYEGDLPGSSLVLSIDKKYLSDTQMSIIEITAVTTNTDTITECQLQLNQITSEIARLLAACIDEARNNELKARASTNNKK